MKVRMVGDRLLVKRVEEIKQKGGIIIPDMAKEKPLEAIVIAVGTGRTTKDGTVIPLYVQPDDKVIIEKYSGSEVTIDNEDYLIIREDGVLAILEKEEDNV